MALTCTIILTTAVSQPGTGLETVFVYSIHAIPACSISCNFFQAPTTWWRLSRVITNPHVMNTGGGKEARDRAQDSRPKRSKDLRCSLRKRGGHGEGAHDE